MSDLTSAPKIAILLATIHRPEDILGAVAAAQQLDYPCFEIRIIDQSTDDRTADAVLPLLEDARLHYERQAPNGLSAALNLAASGTDAELLAITGDDCVMRQSWLEEIAAAFARDEGHGIVFGNVVPGQCELDEALVPGCLMNDEVISDSITDVHQLNGTTANMAVRRSLWLELQGFDESLGVGAPLCSAEDLDLALRALLAGYTVFQTPLPEVEHRSPTLWRDRAATIRRNWFGSGAALAKGLKLSPVKMTSGLVRLGGRWLRGGSGVAATYGPSPSRINMLGGFASGFLTGLSTGIDRESGHFRRSARTD